MLDSKPPHSDGNKPLPHRDHHRETGLSGDSIEPARDPEHLSADKRLAGVALQEQERPESSDREKTLKEVLSELTEQLPDIARHLITTNHDTTIPANQAFAEHPDDPKHHSTRWHQHGIISHSQEFARAIVETIPGYLEQWGIAKHAEDVLSEPIDGVEKRELLEVASLLHDIGKFTARKFEDDHHDVWHFDDHAQHSHDIVRSDLSDILKRFDFTEKQIDYVADCAKLHFELGEVRKVARSSGVGYTMKFADTPEFKAAAQEIIDQHPDYALEIGLMFIADGLSKSEVFATGTTDDEIENERATLTFELAKRGLSPQLIEQALQMPVNLKVAQVYLDQWAASRE